MEFNDAQVKDILLKGNYIEKEEIEKAEKQAKSQNIALINNLFAHGLITKDLFGQAIAEHFEVPYADLNSFHPPHELTDKISKQIAQKFSIVPYKEKAKSVIIATNDPTQKGIKTALRGKFGKKAIEIAFAFKEDIEEIMLRYVQALETRFTKILKKEEFAAPEIIDEILEDALLFHASDIHFEPREDELLVRFRVDGMLREAGRMPMSIYENILNRIKVQTHLRTDEHFAAQDGAMRHERKSNGTEIDMRISIIPTVEGEKIVIRLLSHYVQQFTLADLGLSEDNEEVVRKIAKKPYGMILSTGPTGSGKTTTLYGLLKAVNTPEINITTIEDPVEYKVEGVNHIQVNTQTDLTFAKGLRSIVRQDPDTILVGEIRDEETAEISVNAALTGHLLLSTFHANDAAATIPRLLDMGIEPFLLSSTLELIIAQRLVRKICDQCKHSETFSRKALNAMMNNSEKYFEGKNITMYKGKGCTTCNHSGYKGRTGIFELIVCTPEIKDLILKNPASAEVWKLARKQGARSMFEDGILKVKEGITTIHEVTRVAQQTPGE